MFANHKGEIPFVILLLPFVAGIGLAMNLQQYTVATLPFTLLICLSTIFILLNISYKKLKTYNQPWLGGLLLHVILFCAGWICAVNYNELNKPGHFSKTPSQYLAIKINNEPVVKNGLMRFSAQVSENFDSTKRSPVSGKLLIAIKDSAAFGLNYGDVLLIPANYNTVDPPYNPGEFNYKQYLAHQNIFHQEFLYPHQYVVMAHNSGNPVIAYSLKVRKRLVASFNTHMRDSSAIAVASAMILGYRADMSEDVLQAYTKTGTLHVLSVSGAHVAIIFILLGWALSFLDRIRHGKTIKALIIITLVWAYALLTGFSPAVNRAALMISLIIGGNNFYRYINPLNLLAVSAFALLLYNPFYLTDVGFQLSYLAIGGLIVFEPVLYNSLTIENRWLDKLWKLCSVSIAAQVITFPLSAYYFHQFPVYFLISNLFILLPVVVIMYLGVAFIAFSGIAGIATVLGYLLEKSIIFLNKGLSVTAQLPFASVDKLWINTLDYLLIYGAITLFFYFLFNRNRRLLNTGLALLLIVTVNVAWKSTNTFERSSITFLNLKKQRAIVFKNGKNAVVLTDMETSDKNYRYAIQPGLDSARVENIKVFKMPDNINTRFLKKKGSLLQFQNKKLLIVDSAARNLHFPGSIKVDYIFITQNTPVDQLIQNFKSSLVVISADNSPRYIDSLTKQLNYNKNKYYVLKRNRSLNLIAN